MLHMLSMESSHVIVWSFHCKRLFVVILDCSVLVGCIFVGLVGGFDLLICVICVCRLIFIMIGI